MLHYTLSIALLLAACGGTEGWTEDTTPPAEDTVQPNDAGGAAPDAQRPPEDAGTPVDVQPARDVAPPPEDVVHPVDTYVAPPDVPSPPQCGQIGEACCAPNNCAVNAICRAGQCLENTAGQIGSTCLPIQPGGIQCNAGTGCTGTLTLQATTFGRCVMGVCAACGAPGMPPCITIAGGGACCDNTAATSICN